MTTRDLGDGLRGELQVMAGYADLLRQERDDAIRRADSYLELIHTAVKHHLEAHPDCEGYHR